MANESILIDSLDLWEQGDSAEQIMAQYPEAAGEIQPILATAGQLTQLAPQPYLAAKQASQQAFLAEAAALQVAPAPRFLLRGRTRQLFLSFASLAAIFILVAAALFLSSTSALPGDLLYGAKRFGESGRLLLTGNADAIRELSAEYQAERIREIEALLAEGRAADVEFEGRIEEITVGRWVIAGLVVEVGSDTRIEGTPQVGEIARVAGRTANGRLLASRIMILTGAPRPPALDDEPALIPTATTTPTPTSEPETTTEPAEIIAPLAATATPTPSPTAMPEPPPPPALTLTPDDDGASGESEGGDDSGGSGNGDGETGEEDEEEDNSGSGGGDGEPPDEEGDDEPPEDDDDEPPEDDDDEPPEDDDDEPPEDDDDEPPEDDDSETP
jgi:hypothetical protein